MISESALSEANGLVAHFYRAERRNAPHTTLFAIQRRLLEIGVKLDSPVSPPDPTAPAGGTAIAMRAAA